MKKKFLAYLLCFMIFPLSACSFNNAKQDSLNSNNNSDTSTEANVDESNDSKDDIKKESGSSSKIYELSDDWKNAIAELSLNYDHFDSSNANTEDWPQTFVAHFIQNSRLSFSYIDNITDKNDGMISIDEISKMQESLTGVDIDFSKYYSEPINVNDSSSFMQSGKLSDVETTDNGDTLEVKAKMDVISDGIDSTEKKIVNAKLKKNQNSVLDGYSIESIDIQNDDSNSNDESLKWALSFADFLKKNIDYGSGDFVFTLSYIDDDDIPELIYGLTNPTSGSDIIILKYNNGNIQNIGPFGANGMLSFYERKNVICTQQDEMGLSNTYYSALPDSGNDIKNLCSSEAEATYDNYENLSNFKYSINDNAVTKDEFSSYLKKIIGNSDSKTWSSYENENNYPVLNDENLKCLSDGKYEDFIY